MISRRFAYCTPAELKMCLNSESRCLNKHLIVFHAWLKWPGVNEPLHPKIQFGVFVSSINMRYSSRNTPLFWFHSNKTAPLGFLSQLLSWQKSERTFAPKDKSSLLSFLVTLTRQLFCPFASRIESLYIDLNYSAGPVGVYFVKAFCDLLKLWSKTFSHVDSCHPGTEKVRRAQDSNHLHVVNPDWLWSCLERWERVEETLYPLKEDYSKMPR